MNFRRDGRMALEDLSEFVELVKVNVLARAAIRELADVCLMTKAVNMAQDITPLEVRNALDTNRPLGRLANEFVDWIFGVNLPIRPFWVGEDMKKENY
jgi:hypothetical protein